MTVRYAYLWDKLRSHNFCSVPSYTNEVFSGTSGFSRAGVHTAASVIFSVTGVLKLYSKPPSVQYSNAKPLFSGSAGLDAVFPLSMVCEDTAEPPFVSNDTTNSAYAYRRIICITLRSYNCRDNNYGQKLIRQCILNL